jgi:type I restriction enzyme, S subunit
MTAASVVFPKAFAVWFKDLERWDVSSFQKISWHWPREIMTPIGSVLRLRKEKIDRKKFKFSELQPITIHFDGSMDKRVVDAGREYTMDLWFARPGDIVVAKIDLKNGAVGIVPDDWQNAAVTGHFAIYEPDRAKLLPEFFHRVIQAKFFKANLWRNKVGAEGRKEVKLEFFERQEIPLPPLAEQKAIVARWREAQKRIAAARSSVEKMKQELPQVIYRALGTPPPLAEKSAERCFAVWWKDLARWSMNYLSRARRGLLGFSKSKFPIVPLGEHLTETMNGYCIKPVQIPTPHKMLKLNALAPGGLDLKLSKFIKIPEKIAERFSIRKDDLFICRSVGSYDHVAKCALAKETASNIVFPDTMIRVRFKDLLLPAFVGEVIQTPLGRSFFQSNARTAVGMWKIGADDILAFPIPVPPLAVQREIVARMASTRAEIARELEAAARLVIESETEIESRILGVKQP